MKEKAKSKVLAILLALMMTVTLTPASVMAMPDDVAADSDAAVTEEKAGQQQPGDTESDSISDSKEKKDISPKASSTSGETGENTNQNENEEIKVPTLKEGVAPTAEAQVPVNEAYLLGDLQEGNIFQPAEGQSKLNYQNYYYQRSTDGGKTWGSMQDFSEAIFGWTTIQFTEKAVGTYMYRVYASHDGKNMSKDTWTLTLNVVEKGIWNTSFHVGKDYNYSNNDNHYPVIKLYKTTGVDKTTNKDYVGWFENESGEKVYVTEPTDFEIAGNKEDGYTADGCALNDFEPVTFTDSAFGKDGETGIESGTVEKNYNMFYASLEAGRYSFRGYGYNTDTGEYDKKLGGMSIKIPTDKNVDGGAGGGTDIYIQQLSIYTTSKKIDDTYFSADEYYTKLDCPIMGCTASYGDVYNDGNYAYYPYMIYAAGNACLYNFYGYPQEHLSDKYIFTQNINATFPAGYNAQKKTVSINTAVDLTVTAPERADFALYFQWNNFNTTEVEPIMEPETADGMTTYKYKVSKGNNNYTWRLTDKDGKYVTKSGWLSGINDASELAYSFDEKDETNKKTHSFDNLGTQVEKRDEADLMVNLDPSGFENIGKDETERVRLYRHWEIINSDAGNIMIEPDFNYEILDGKADINAVNGGNTTSNWLDVDPEGTAIVATNYDAMEVSPENHGSHGGLFPATNPERTGVFVLSEEAEGNADADVDYNMAVGATTTRSDDWDYNYDTWYYSTDDKAPALDFKVKDAKGDVKVEYALVTTDENLKSKLSGWNTVKSEDEVNYTADLTEFRNNKTNGGTVIIKMTDESGVSYRLVRAAEMKVTAVNASNPDEPFMPGDEVTLTFDGLYRAVNKISGIFNPTTFYLRYTSAGEEINGKLGQYQKMDNTSLTLTIPEDLKFKDGEKNKEFDLTNGYVYGSMYSAANPFAYLYSMTDTGVGTNFNAVTVNFYISKLADTSITVNRKAVYDVKLNVTDGKNMVEGANLQLTNPKGEEVTADENGIYKELGYGRYSYEVSKEGYVVERGAFKLGSSTASEIKDGIVTKTIKLTKAAEGAWDGQRKSEPELKGDVYQIGTGAELAWFAEAVNSGNASINGELVKDIDLAAHEWTSIGSASQKFTGTFDGNQNRIYNLYIGYSSTTTTSPYQGLFGYVNNSEISNLRLSGAVSMETGHKSGVTNAYSGALCGAADNTTFDNVISDVDVKVNRTAGNWAYIGGIAGKAQNCTITQCVNTGDIQGYYYVGGIAGQALQGTQIDRCHNDGNVSGHQYIGGIAGQLSSSSNAANGISSITNSYNRGNITAAGNYSGGLMAQLQANTNEYQKNAVKNSYSTGTVLGASYSGAAIGAINNANAVVENVYYLEGAAAAGMGDDKGDHEAISKTEAQLKAKDMIDKLNGTQDDKVFGEDILDANDGYPVLVCRLGGVVLQMVDDLGTITLESGSKIEAVEAAYDSLPEAEKAKVTNIDKIEKAKASLKKMTAAFDAIEKLDEKVTLKSGEAINEASKLYNELSDEEKEQVTNGDKLIGLVTNFNQINETYNDINAIGNVTVHSGDTVKAAREAYDALSKAQKKQIINYAELEIAEREYNEIIKVYDGIQKLDDLTEEEIIKNENNIKAARKAYEALGVSQKKKIENLSVLAIAEKDLSDLKKVNTPAVVSGLKAKASNYKTVNVSWKAAKNAKGYAVYRATSKNGTYKLLISTTRTSVTNASLATGTTYYYKVKSYGKVGSAKVYAAYSKTAYAKPVLSKPANIKAKAGKKSAVVSWKKVSGATGYKVYRATKSNGKYSVVKTITKQSTVKYTNKKLKSKKTYYYKVRAYKKVNGKLVYGSYSKIVKVKAK